MRAVSQGQLVFSTGAAVTGAGQRTDFVQSSAVSDLLARLVEIVALLQAEQGSDWDLVFVNLAGGGNGAEFVLELRWANNGSAGVDGSGIDGGQVLAFGALASQSAANQLAFIAALAAFEAPLAANNVVLQQTLLAGASQGTRVGDLVFVTNSGGQ